MSVLARDDRVDTPADRAAAARTKQRACRVSGDARVAQSELRLSRSFHLLNASQPRVTRAITRRGPQPERDPGP